MSVSEMQHTEGAGPLMDKDREGGKGERERAELAYLDKLGQLGQADRDFWSQGIESGVEALQIRQITKLPRKLLNVVEADV